MVSRTKERATREEQEIALVVPRVRRERAKETRATRAKRSSSCNTGCGGAREEWSPRARQQVPQEVRVRGYIKHVRVTSPATKL